MQIIFVVTFVLSVYLSVDPIFTLTLLLFVIQCPVKLKIKIYRLLFVSIILPFRLLLTVCLHQFQTVH